LYSAFGHSAPSLSTTSVRANAGAAPKQRRTDAYVATRRISIDPLLYYVGCWMVTWCAFELTVSPADLLAPPQAPDSVDEPAVHAVVDTEK